MRSLALAVPVFVLSSCVMGPTVWVTDHEAFQIERGELSAVRCATHNGAIEVAGGDGDKIEVRVTKRAGGWDEADADAALAAIEITHKRVEGGLALGWRWREPRDAQWGAVVSFDVVQPRDLPLTVDTHNGAVRIADLAGAIAAETHNGSITVQDCSGKVQAHTHNGRIVADIAAPEVDLSTHNGGVQVTLSGQGPVAGNIRTHNGAVSVGVADGRSARLVCTTRNGSVKATRALAHVEKGRNFLVAEVGERGGRLEVETHNGSIRIE